VVKIGALTVVATIKMRRGEPNPLPLLLEAKTLAFETTELQRIIPALLALLEYEWITGKSHIEDQTLDGAINMFFQAARFSKKSRFLFWLRKVRRGRLSDEMLKAKNLNSAMSLREQVALWEELCSPYEKALSLFEGTDEEKRTALTMMQQLGANAICEKLKMEMRSSGIKKIPRGLRRSTKINPAQLTNRELEVLQLLRKGIQNKEIANALFISAKTVDHHISSILFKLDVKSRATAVAEAARLGILK